MNAITDLSTLLATLNPSLVDGEFVFITRADGRYGDGAGLNPIAAFMEEEGLTLVVPKEKADGSREEYQGEFRMITLRVHSSLEAVGLTAAVASALAKHGISVNAMAAFYHDHLFVPSSRADEAMVVLREFMSA
ncbi:hypothetical protein SAMN06265222_10719 [Neorhodopirellula lusitana]|uniref:DUF2241 domain-containing protein n=1 Tax=Neorhodopirellula lusitana TaxID=445327 RepID=A0ABY1Q6S7_9BACT|nr:ACT domain-containing protein [Neorhodopirellula lusitana]SMP60922.1 hypothetical protein SAMN06265222_10719 [Neorhodopirellula lusitana]